jgi:hypothetical protein
MKLQHEINKIIKNIDWKEIDISIEDYLYVLINKNKSKDSNYRNAFKKYFGLRIKRGEKTDSFFDLLESYQNKKTISYDEIINDLKNITNRNEMSYASKIFSLLKPDEPTIDIKICNHFAIKRPNKASLDMRIAESIVIHRNLKDEINKLLLDKRVVEIIEVFRKRYKNIAGIKMVHDVKIIDFVLWKNKLN